MTHLGADVAAYVDGQLSDSAMRDAATHLQRCDECDRAVRQQRLIKSRMSTGATPTPPPDLVDTLTRLTAVPPEPDSWWTRLCRLRSTTVGLAVLGASMAVMAAAYVVGGSERFDPVRPGFDDYASEFIGATTRTLAATYSVADPDHLHAKGWPCHESLAGNLRRTTTGYDRTRDLISVSYTDGRHRLRLYEQAGRLDPEVLSGFTRQQIGGATVWVRPGVPTLATWDRDGIVFTIVTDIDAERLGLAVAQLPVPTTDRSPWERIGGGIDRITAWAAA